jgi:hypothetical protein
MEGTGKVRVVVEILAVLASAFGLFSYLLDFALNLPIDLRNL